MRLLEMPSERVSFGMHPWMGMPDFGWPLTSSRHGGLPRRGLQLPSVWWDWPGPEHTHTTSSPSRNIPITHINTHSCRRSRSVERVPHLIELSDSEGEEDMEDTRYIPQYRTYRQISRAEPSKTRSSRRKSRIVTLDLLSDSDSDEPTEVTNYARHPTHTYVQLSHKDLSSKTKCRRKSLTVPMEVESYRSRPEFSDDDDDGDLEVMGTSRVSVSPRKQRSLQGIEEDILAGDMLSDETINLAQNLLHEQFPEVGGLEDTTLGPVGHFSVCRGPFVQVLHDPVRHHWVCVANTQASHDTVDVYDSLERSTISREIEEQVRSMVNDEVGCVQIIPKAVQQQTNGTDCGVFALAFATSLLYGQDPCHVKYDVSKMRTHLLDCLNAKLLTPFPEV